MVEINANKLNWLLEKSYETKIPLDIKGPPGIGKSEIIKDTMVKIAEQNKLKFVDWNRLSAENKENVLKEDITKQFIFADIRLSQMDQTDLKGFPNAQKEWARWIPMLLFKVLSQPEAKGCVFFDEINLATPSVVASCYQIINDHQIGETPISKNILFVSAGNRLSDTNNAFEDPAPLNNRRGNMVLNPPIVRSSDPKEKTWTTWAIEHNIDSRIIAYLNCYETDIFRFEEDNKDPSFPTPRTWAKLSKMIANLTNPKEIKLCAAIMIGEGTALKFYTYIKMAEKINVKEILNNPELIKKYDKPEDIDKKYSIISTVSEMYVKDKKVLDKALALCNYIEPEYGMFMLRMMKSFCKGNFGTELNNTKNWQTISEKYFKFLFN